MSTGTSTPLAAVVPTAKPSSLNSVSISQHICMGGCSILLQY